MGREQDYYQSGSCNCNYNKHSHSKTITYRENYAIPDDNFYEKEDVRWCKSSDTDYIEECSHRRVPSIDRDTRRALSSFRRKAAQFEESEYNSESDSSQTLDECCSHCECSGVMKKAQDLLNYTPESNFLKKLKKQSEMAHGEGHNKNRRPVNESLLDDNGCSGCGCKCYEDKNLEQHKSEEVRQDRLRLQNDMRMCDKISPIKEQEVEEDCSQKSLKSHKVKSNEHVKIAEKVTKGNEENIRPVKKAGVKKKGEAKKGKKPAQKVQHVSRARKKSPKLKRKPGECQGTKETESLSEFAASLKRPRPDSCERCWKYASPARSPVNKPDQRYDPNYRRAHGFSGEVGFGSGDFGSEEIDHETKVMELMTPFGSMERGQGKSPVRQEIRERPKSKGAKKNKSQTKKNERPHTSAMCPPADQNKNWDSIDSTQYLEPPGKITVTKKPTGPPKPKTAPAKTTQRKTTPVKKDKPLEQKKSEKLSKVPSSKELPSSPSPPEDSPETQIKTIDIDLHPEKPTCPCSQKTETRVPLVPENIPFQRQPTCPCKGASAKPPSRITSTIPLNRPLSYSKPPSQAPSTIPLQRQESTTCNCKINRHTHRSEEFLKPVPSRHSAEHSNRSYKSSCCRDQVYQSPSRPRTCHCSNLNYVPRQQEEPRRVRHSATRVRSQKCCCKCHCGTKHCVKQKNNERLFPEPMSRERVRTETDTSDDFPCSCPECRMRWQRIRQNYVRSDENEKASEKFPNKERICSCRGKKSQNDIAGPKKYSVYYMTEDRNLKNNEIEVLVEGLKQKSRKSKKDKTSSRELENKINNITQYRPDSMALRFQKGVTEKQRTPTSPRVLYF